MKPYKLILSLIFFFSFSFELISEADGFQIYFGNGLLKKNYVEKYMGDPDYGMLQYLRFFNSKTTLYDNIKNMEYYFLLNPKKPYAITNNYKFRIIYELAPIFSTGFSMTYANIYLKDGTFFNSAGTLYDINKLYFWSLMLKPKNSSNTDPLGIDQTSGIFDKYLGDPLMQYAFIKFNLDRKKVKVDSIVAMSFDLCFKTYFEYFNYFLRLSIPIPYGEKALSAGIASGFMFDFGNPFFLSIEGYKEWYGLSNRFYSNIYDTGIRVSIGFTKKDWDSESE